MSVLYSVMNVTVIMSLSDSAGIAILAQSLSIAAYAGIAGVVSIHFILEIFSLIDVSAILDTRDTRKSPS